MAGGGRGGGQQKPAGKGWKKTGGGKGDPWATFPNSYCWGVIVVMLIARGAKYWSCKPRGEELGRRKICFLHNIALILSLVVLVINHTTYHHPINTTGS